MNLTQLWNFCNSWVRCCQAKSFSNSQGKNLRVLCKKFAYFRNGQHCVIWENLCWQISILGKTATYLKMQLPDKNSKIKKNRCSILEKLHQQKSDVLYNYYFKQLKYLKSFWNIMYNYTLKDKALRCETF